MSVTTLTGERVNVRARVVKAEQRNGTGNFADDVDLEQSRKVSVALALNETSSNTNGHNGNGFAPGTHLPVQLPSRLWLRDYIRRVWGHVVNAMVKQADDGTYAITKGTARVFLATILSIAVAVGAMMLYQRDEITRLRTLADVQTKTNESLKSDVDQAKNWAQTAKGDYRELQGRFEQFALDYAVNGKKNNQRSLQE